MKKIIFVFVSSLVFNFCWGQQKRNDSNKESVKKTINSFIEWYCQKKEKQKNKVLDSGVLHNSIVLWEEIDTLVKPTVNMIAVEGYLNILKTSSCLSETFINNLRQYHQTIKNELEAVDPSPKSEGIYSIPGLNLDVVFRSFEPEEIFDRYKTGVFRQISIIQNKAIAQFYIPQSSNFGDTKMLFTLTKEKDNWLLDYIGYYN